MGVSISRSRQIPVARREVKAPVTKLDLAQYFGTVGRLDDGASEGPAVLASCACPIALMATKRFFQRRASASTSHLLEQVKVSGDRDNPILQVDRVEGLVALAQLGATELHPWNCEVVEPDLPGRLVFDLDPAPDVKFDEVIKAALEVRKRLEAWD